MPTTTRSTTQRSRTTAGPEQHAQEIESFRIGIAPGLPGDDHSELVERCAGHDV